MLLFIFPHMSLPRKLPMALHQRPLPLTTLTARGEVRAVHYSESSFLEDSVIPFMYAFSKMWHVRALFLMFAISGRSIHRTNSCPLELSPSSVVVRFGDPVSVNCTSSQNQGMGWEAPEGGTAFKPQFQFLTWSLASLRTWSIRPLCYTTLPDHSQCVLHLEVTVYKTPDQVLIFEPNSTGAMRAGASYPLQLDVINIAPVRNLSVTWYKGKEVIHTETRDKDIATPQNESFHLSITPTKEDDGIQIQCKVQMNLSLSGPQWTPIMSELYTMVVFYPPAIIGPQEEILDLAVDDKPVLNCSAEGKPQPQYTWLAPAGYPEALGSWAVLRPSVPLLPGTYNCTASNTLAFATKLFIVRSTNSNWGLIAGIIVSVLILLLLAMLAFVIYKKRK